MIFAAFPIMWYAVFDFEYEKSYLLSNPKTYEIGLSGRCFGTKVFWYWFSYGTF